MRSEPVKKTSLGLYALAAALILISPLDLFARVGGGHSYSGGGGHGGGGGGGDGGGGAIAWLLFEAIRLLFYLTIEYPLIGIPLDAIVIGGLLYFFVFRQATSTRLNSFSTAHTTALDVQLDICQEQQNVSQQFNQLRKFDPNFSEIVFTDFAYALYAKAHEARGRGVAGLDQFSPYLSEEARKSLLQRNPPGLVEVKGVIVGAMRVTQLGGLETPMVRITVLFDSNYTEVVNTNGSTSEMTYYVREEWRLERKRDRLSPPPAQATALHCPRCGAPLQKDTVGACAFCRTKIDSGEFQWYVGEITLLSREAKGPLLTSDVPEAGTDLPTVLELDFARVKEAFEFGHPTFSWQNFEERSRMIFNELQSAWSTQDWGRARPHETDNIFQMHQYWIDAYNRQGLRNVVDNLTVTAMRPVKIQEDAFYNAITLRIWAQGYDYTVDSSGRLISSSKTDLRQWSEYWTFIRNRRAGSGAARTDLNCPNCGAPLKVSATGICEFCGGKITSGDFDWVLSKIEQDDAYAG